jgi:hypothetical protein
MFTTFLTVAATLLAAESPHVPYPAQPDQIGQLNQCIQARFSDRTSFGMNRLGGRISPHQDVRTFKPETPTEQAVVDQLRSKGYEVLVYLAGRNVLAKPPASNLGAYRYDIQGPALITHPSLPVNPPSNDWLLAAGRQALLSFHSGNGYTVQNGEWTVTMRPLRAANAACVECHTRGIARPMLPGAPSIAVFEPQDGLAIGDPLGVAIYAYRQSSHVLP